MKISKEAMAVTMKDHWEKVLLGGCALLLVAFFAYGLLFASADDELKNLETKADAIRKAINDNPSPIGEKQDYRKLVFGPWQPSVGNREFNFPIALDWLPFPVEATEIVYKKQDDKIIEFRKDKDKILPTPIVETPTAATESGVTLQWKIDDKQTPPDPEKEEWAAPAHYVVDRRLKGKGEYETIAKEVKDLKFVDKNVEPMTEYEYRVTAIAVDPAVKKAIGTPSAAKSVKTASNLKISFSGQPVMDATKPGDRPSIQVTVSVFKDDVWHLGEIIVKRVEQGTEVRDKRIFEGTILNGVIHCRAKHDGDKSCNKTIEVKGKIQIQKFTHVTDAKMVRRCSQCPDQKIIINPPPPLPPTWKVDYLDDEGIAREMWRGDLGPLQFDLCPDCRKKVKPTTPAPTKDIQPKAPSPRDHPSGKDDKKPSRPEGGRKDEPENKVIR